MQCSSVFNFLNSYMKFRALTCLAWLFCKCRKLFELLSLSGALAELAWPTILSKRHMFRYWSYSMNSCVWKFVNCEFCSACHIGFQVLIIKPIKPQDHQSTSKSTKSISNGTGDKIQQFCSSWTNTAIPHSNKSRAYPLSIISWHYLFIINVASLDTLPKSIEITRLYLSMNQLPTLLNFQRHLWLQTGWWILKLHIT